MIYVTYQEDFQVITNTSINYNAHHSMYLRGYAVEREEEVSDLILAPMPHQNHTQSWATKSSALM